MGILTRLAYAICGAVVEAKAKHVEVHHTLTRGYDFLGKDWPSCVLVPGIRGESFRCVSAFWFGEVVWKPNEARGKPPQPTVQ